MMSLRLPIWHCRLTGSPARHQGFTLVELVAVLAIMGILTAAVLQLAEISVRSAKERQLREALWEIRDALDRYKRLHQTGQIASTSAADNGYPPDLLTLVQGAPQVMPDKSISPQTRHFFLRRIPRDPFAQADLPAEKTWGLRSYASSADRPEAGADVYDVFSNSTEKALDGTHYKSW